MTKSIFVVDLAATASSSLAAHLPLTLTSEQGSYHYSYDLRMPLGLYNISIGRVCDKLTRLCKLLENYFQESKNLESLSGRDEQMEQIIDYIELSLYAAAEHVDDIDSIALGFFKNEQLKKKHSAYRTLEKEIKKHKRLVTSVTNAIKHQQSRIRMFSIEVKIEESATCLHGYFIEGVEKGVVCPSSKFHHQQDVFSITTLIWEILVFLLNCSRELAQFLNVIASQVEGPVKTDSKNFALTVAAAARLPLYSFGEEHPFSRVTMQLLPSQNDDMMQNSNLYGSLHVGWPHNLSPEFGSAVSRFSGDGESRTFRFAQPKNIAFHHWSS